MLSATILVSVFTAGCNKIDSNKTESQNPSTFLNAMFFDDVERDFTIITSSVHPVGLYESNPLTESSTSNQAFNKNGTKDGDLSVNDINIPFTEATYYLGTDTNITSSLFTGGNNVYVYNGSPSIPAISETAYSPATTNLSYSGLIDKKLPKTSPLEISWTADNNLPEGGKAVVILYGKNSMTAHPK